MEKTNKAVVAFLTVLGIFLGSFGAAHAVSTFITGQGGTGTTSPSGILYGDNGATTHLNTVTIGSGLSFSGGTLTNSSPGTTYTATYPITLSGSAFGIAFGTTTSNTWAGTQTFTNAPVVSAFGAGALYSTASGVIATHATTSSSAAYQDVWRDGNQNAFAQNFVSAATSFPSLGNINTLTAASPRTWIITGTKSQGLKLPVATTLGNGTSYITNNNSTGTTTFYDAGSNQINGNILSGGAAEAVLYDNSTSNGSWDIHSWLGHNVLSGSNNVSIGTTTPFASLAIHANPNDTIPYATLFAIGSSTASATTTLFSVLNTGLASSTNLVVSGLGSSGTTCVQASASGQLSSTGAACGTGSGGSDPFTHTTNFGQAASATTTALWLQGSPYSLFASSTVQLTNASTTQLTVSPTGNNLAVTFGSTTAPLTPYTLVQFANQDGLDSDWSFKVAGGSGDGTINFGASAGTLAAPATSTSVSLGQIDGYAYADGAFHRNISIILKHGNLDVASYPSSVEFNVTKSGSTVFYPLLTLDGDSGVSITDSTSGFYATLDTAHLSGFRSYAFPDINGTFGVGVATTSGSLSYWGANSGLYAVATSSVSVGLGLTKGGTWGALVGGSSPTLSIATSSLYTGAANSLAYFSGTNTLGQIAAGTNGFVLAMSGGVPTWVASTTLANISGTLTVNHGGTGQTTFTSSQLLYGNGTANLSSVGTTTPSFGLGLTGTNIVTLTSAGGLPNLSIATSSLYTGSAGQIPYFSGANTLIGTSSITIGTSNSFIGISSTTPSNLFSVGQAAAGFFITTLGKIWGRDTTNAFEGIISPTRSFVLGTATTTTWTATSTGAYVPTITMPFAGTLKQARCTASSTQAFLGTQVFINTTNITPTYFVSSSTVGVEKFTASNTFNAGDVISTYFGTTTSDANAKSISCTFDVVQTS